MFHYIPTGSNKPAGPEHRCTTVAMGHKVYAFPHYFEDTREHMVVHVFNTVSLRWTEVYPVTPGEEKHPAETLLPCCHTAVAVGETIYIFGGSTTEGLSNTLYAFDTNDHTWSKPRVSGTVPEARFSHSACVLGKDMFIHGGCTDEEQMNDIYKLDTTTMIWSLVDAGGPAPHATDSHSATFIGTKMFVFGGYSTELEGFYNAARVFDTETNQWMDTPPAYFCPDASWGHSAFAYRGELYVFSGSCRDYEDEEVIVSDLWRYNPRTFTWRECVPHQVYHIKGSGLLSVPESCCRVGDRVVLFEGYEQFVLYLNPSLETLSKLAVLQHDLDQSELPRNVRCDLEAMSGR